MPYIEGPRHYRITAEDHGARVLLASYMMMVNTILSVLVRTGIKLTTSRKWAWDDTVIASAAVMAVGHSISMARAYDSGLGKHIAAVDQSAYLEFQRALYASNVLYLTAIVLAKISVLLFILRLTPSRSTLRVCQGALMFLILWGIATILTMTFACPAKSPWHYSAGKCIDLGAFTQASTAFDIATDAFLVGLPLYIFGRMQYPKGGRWTVVGVFSVRAFIIVPSTLRLMSVKPAFENPNQDFTWNCVVFQIWEVIGMHFSIISASVPCVRPFLRSLESGLLDSSMRLHPRLQSDATNKPRISALTTISGWAAGRVLDNDQRGSTGNSQNTMHKSILCNGAPSRESGQETRDENQDFARQLRPDWSEHKTKIRSSRTFPQFSKLPSTENNKETAARGSTKWVITITQETNITFEVDEKNAQETKTSSSNGGDVGLR